MTPAAKWYFRSVAVPSILLVGVLAWPFTATGQGYFSPTYAASAEGSPYSEVYSRTFGASGDPRLTLPSEPLETAAGTPAALADGLIPGPVVYVIDSQGMLTFRSEDFAEGKGEAIGRNSLPAAPASAAPPRVPTVADSLYLRPPEETATGSAAPAPP